MGGGTPAGRNPSGELPEGGGSAGAWRANFQTSGTSVTAYRQEHFDENAIVNPLTPKPPGWDRCPGGPNQLNRYTPKEWCDWYKKEPTSFDKHSTHANYVSTLMGITLPGLAAAILAAQQRERARDRK